MRRSRLTATSRLRQPGQISRVDGQKIQGSQRILEIGTLGGYSTIWLALGVAPGGEVVTIEASAAHSGVAANNFALAGLDDKITLINAQAIEALPRMLRERVKPFDLIFIDADKPNNPVYFHLAYQL